MTFSITGHCARTGMVGVAVTTSSICVGSRCPHARAGVGAVAIQNVTDPTLAVRVFERLEAGATATEAVAAVMDGRVNADYRQLAVVDMAGRTGHFTGAHILGTNRVVEGDHCIAAGNLLSTSEGPAAMVAGFTIVNYTKAGKPFQEAIDVLSGPVYLLFFCFMLVNIHVGMC